MRRSWKGSGEDFVALEGMADAERTVGLALMSSGMMVDGGNKNSAGHG